MELSKFTKMKVTPKGYCVRQTNGGLQSQLAIILCGIHPIIKSSNQMLPTSSDVWRIKYFFTHSPLCLQSCSWFYPKIGKIITHLHFPCEPITCESRFSSFDFSKLIWNRGENQGRSYGREKRDIQICSKKSFLIQTWIFSSKHRTDFKFGSGWENYFGELLQICMSRFLDPLVSPGLDYTHLGENQILVTGILLLRPQQSPDI